MDSSSTIHSLSASGTGLLATKAPPVTDKTLRIARTAEYPKEVWYSLASIIVFIGCCQLVSIIVAKLAKRAPLSSRHPTNPEGPAPRGILLRRIPSAAVNTFRVVAFRSTINFGSYSVNIAETFLTCLYIIALFTWAFVNSKSQVCITYCLILSSSLATDLSGHELSVQYWGNRCGALTASQLPLITALGTKNSVISGMSSLYVLFAFV